MKIRIIDETIVFDVFFICQLNNVATSNWDQLIIDISIVVILCIIKILNSTFNSSLHRNASNINSVQNQKTVIAAIKAFEQKASTQPLHILSKEATELLQVFKQNVHCINEYALSAAKWSGESNTIYKIKLYTGKYIDIKVHVLALKHFEETSYHNHYKHMILQNLVGDYIHTTWNINTEKSGYVYKFSNKKGSTAISETAEIIKGQLEYVEVSNYTRGSWKCLHPKTIHTIKAGISDDRIISFVIQSNVDVNEDRYVLSQQPTLNIKPEFIGPVFGEERENALRYIIDAVH